MRYKGPGVEERKRVNIDRTMSILRSIIRGAKLGRYQDYEFSGIGEDNKLKGYIICVINPDWNTNLRNPYIRQWANS